jgi:4-amino-4-deoxy-L-arabinose transferase-like glycosyltransferase
MTDYKNRVVNSFLYKYRYVIGYSVLALIFISVIFLVALLLPGGVTNGEVNSVVKSSQINIWSLKGLMTVDAPYRLLQMLAIRIFGLSTFSIKITSCLVALASLILTFLLVKEWCGEKIAIISSLITSTCSYFLFISQSGTPDILCLLLPMASLLIGTYIIKEKGNLYLLSALLLITLILSISTPLCIYVLLSILVGAFLHPHLRYLFINKIYKKHRIITVSLVALTIVLIAAHALINHSYLLAFFGIDSLKLNPLNNLKEIGNNFFIFTTSGSSSVLNPVIGLGSLVIIVLGIYNQIKNHQSSISYILGVNLVFCIPLILLSVKGFQDTYLPIAILLLSSGIDCLLNSWYKLFPKNPYARTLGLVLTLLLVSSITITNLTTYVYSYLYNPVLANQFSEDLNILPKDVKTILVSDNEYDFYKLLGKYNGYNVSTSISDLGFNTKKFIATTKYHRDFVGYDITRIITNDRINHSNRFYVYQKSNY